MPLGRAPTRLVGFDPGLATFGAAAVAVSGGRRTLIDLQFWGSKRNPKLQVTTDRYRRSLALGDLVRAYLEHHRPAAVCCEVSWMTRGQNAVISLAIAFAIVTTVCGELGVPLVPCTPIEIKRAVTGCAARDVRNVDDVQLRRALVRAYPPAAQFIKSVKEANRQHPFDGLGAIETLRGHPTVTEAIARSQHERVQDPPRR